MIEVPNFNKRTVEYSGKGVSLNDFYSQGHWSKRNNIRNEYHPIFENLIDLSGIEEMSEFGIIVTYNSRHDPDNVTGLEKLFVDCLKSRGRITDDSKKYYKFYCVQPDESLKTNTFIFDVYKIR